MGEKESMLQLEVKRIGDYYYVVKGFTKLRTCIYPHDLIGEPNGKVYPVELKGKFASIKLENGKAKNIGFHSEYIKRYFEL